MIRRRLGGMMPDAMRQMTTAGVVAQAESFGCAFREPSWEPVEFIAQEWANDHFATYTKPRPATWWQWHSEVSNVPLGPMVP